MVPWKKNPQKNGLRKNGRQNNDARKIGPRKNSILEILFNS